MKSTKLKMKAADRRERALAMRKDGKTFQAIADELGISKPSAFKTVQVGLLKQVERYSETAEQIISQELDRLDLMLNKMMTVLNVDVVEIIEAGAEETGESLDYSALARLVSSQFQAVEKILKIMERRAKLLGLDKPTKVVPTDPTGNNPYDGITESERNRRILEIIAEAQSGGAIITIEGECKSIMQGVN